jgi:predicted dehydrogenase
LPQGGVVLALGYQRRRESHFRWIKQEIEAGRFGKLVNAEANISRDRLGKIDLSSWRYQAAGMPGGVMLQIGIHYTDVLEYLLGPIVAVRGQLAQLCCPATTRTWRACCWSTRTARFPRSTPATPRRPSIT